MKYPKVFIIILNWNGLQDTLECLESVYKLNYPNFEVIVVDNGSTDDSATAIRENYRKLTIIENKENRGYTGGNNIAIRYAMQYGADYLWLLNNDTIVEPDTVSKLVAAAEKSPDIGLVSPVIYYYDKPNQLQFCGSYVDWKRMRIIYPENKTLNIEEEFIRGRNICLSGAALLIKKSVIEKVGYFEEKYFAYWEDTEYSIRVNKAGFRNQLCVNAKIYHKNPPPITGKIRQSAHFFYYMTRNKYFLYTKDLKLFGKLFYYRSYLIDILMTAVYCMGSGNGEAANACFDGAWAAIRDIGGPWDKKNKMPFLLKKIFLFLCLWHPYFLGCLLKGNFPFIISEVVKRIKLKILKIEV